MTIFYLLTTGNIISTRETNINQKELFPPQDVLPVSVNNLEINDELTYDLTSIKELNNYLTEIINFHKDFLDSCIPEEIDVEFLRITKKEQAIHSLKENKIEEKYAEFSPI